MTNIDNTKIPSNADIDNNQTLSDTGKEIAEHFLTGLEKGSESADGNNKGWLGRLKETATGFAVDKVAEKAGEEIGKNPNKAVLEPLRQATTSYVEDETGTRHEKAKKYIFDAVKIDPKKDSLWTKFKKGFFATALSLGTYITAFVGINYAERKLGYKFNKKDRSWIQMILAILGIGAARDMIDNMMTKKKRPSQNATLKTAAAHV